MREMGLSSVLEKGEMKCDKGKEWLDVMGGGRGQV